MSTLTLRTLPPSPVSAMVPVDLRLAIDSPAVAGFRVRCLNEFYGADATMDGVWRSATVRLDFRGRPGKYDLVAEALDCGGNPVACTGVALTILDSPHRSTGLIDGAWCGIRHWSDVEGRLWNRELEQFTAADWRDLVRGMRGIGMNIIILQELFRNDQYCGRHDIPATGYRGDAFYPSRLFPGRMQVGCADPVEAIMAAADEFGMSVLPGVGMYAWFDYSAPSLEWHCRVAEEIWQRYGHHASFYGWYISEEGMGSLYNGGDVTSEDIIAFFREFRRCKNRFNPALPVMLAPNCYYVPQALDAWDRLARELDIICPFAFHRMPEDDIGPAEAMKLFQRIADRNGAHLWLDMEAFLFTEDQALYPRPLEQIVAELDGFTTFEKVLCYQYPGLFNAPDAARRPGGDDTVALYRNYRNYYLEHLAELTGAAVVMA